ncbi:pentapeptide repeat-containing protein [Nitrosomonas communis]|uniref:pentapeptide repeat-containing protein n=1 Tax=Nitrosomonas communis TaxID=44574 RepID=UPI0026EC87D0|nr:pentapeptide repeat-containing protein [Nitrosomonas communis]MCO6427073.1 pentapeptide repeat-containing protein [Nitrosomonas communis]
MTKLFVNRLAVFKSRVFVIFIIGISEAFLLYSYNDTVILYFQKYGNNIAWLGPLLTMIVASPIAYCIWIFRNEDKKRDQQHTEENIRQSDFHKIEEWATSFPILNEVNGEKKAELTINKEGTLQIAAIYQLLPYLKGDYGNRFVRPSMEIYRSLFSSWVLTSEEQKEILRQYSIDLTASKNVIKPQYINSLHTIFSQDLNFFRTFHKNEVCVKSNWIPLEKIDLKYSHFNNGTNFQGINLLEANLSLSVCFNTNLESTNFICSIFYGSDFRESTLKATIFRGARLSNSDFRGAKFIITTLALSELCRVDFRGANLGRAYFHNANLKKADFRGANIRNANFVKEFLIDENTSVSDRLFNVNFQESNLEEAVGVNVLFA